MSRMILLCVVFAVFSCAAEESIDRLKVAVLRYCEVNGTVEAEAAWCKQFEARVKQRSEDSMCDMESAAQSIAFDWASDNRRELEDYRNTSAKTLLQCCRMLKWFYNGRYSLPAKIKEGMSEANAEVAAKYLEGRITESSKPPK